MSYKRFGFFGITALSLSLLLGAIKDSTAQPSERVISGFIAAGIATAPDYEGSSDYRILPLGFARINYDRYYLQTQGLGVKANLSPFAGVEFGPLLSYRGGRDNDVENSQVSLLRDIDGAVELGGFMRVPFVGMITDRDELAFEVDAVADITNNHDGILISFGPSYSFFALPNLRLSAAAKATYADDNYNDTYFSVDANNAARSGFALYQADSGFKDVSLTMTGNLFLTETVGIAAIASYKHLLDEASNSPIVMDEGQIFGGIGLSYRF
jgi:outer membrane protein